MVAVYLTRCASSRWARVDRLTWVAKVARGAERAGQGDVGCCDGAVEVVGGHNGDAVDDGREVLHQ